MKKAFLKICMLCMVSLFSLNVSAQYNTEFMVTEIEDVDLRANIDLAITGILTAFNNAQGNGQGLALSHLDISQEVKETIMKLWADCPFRCAETEVVERAVKTPRGEYQVRNIPLVMMPVEGVSKDVSWKKYQEGVFTLDKDGMIKADAVEYASPTDKKQVGIEIHSGKNRIVRRIFESLGYHVVKLDRVYFAGLTKKNVRRGDWRYLTEKEVSMLRMGAFE